MLVTRQSFPHVIAKFAQPGIYGVDTETTGLLAYKGDRLFSLILATDDEAAYFNFKSYPGVAEDYVLGREHMAELGARVFSVAGSTWCAHNAKFDMAMLAREGITIAGTVHCTEAVARVERNDQFAYNLGACAARIGEEKSKAVDVYIKQHGLFREVAVPGEDKPEKVPCFDQVPLDVIVPYGLQDARITLKLYHSQIAAIHELGERQAANAGKPQALMAMERRLTKTLFAMEREGLRIDRAYVERALAHEQGLMAKHKEEFEVHARCPLVDSAKGLAPVFDALGLADYPRTAPTKTRPNGTPSFKDEWLATVDHPVGEALREWRTARKKATTYYSNFLYYADANDRIHCNLRQGGTTTGRMSCSNPNLQNLNKEEDTRPEFLVRRAFIPDDDYCLVMLDYDQMEYRLMLDYAGEMGIIDKILNEGLDVHEATARMMGTLRQRAKTLNFLLLYGGGIGKLASALGVTYAQASGLKEHYFSSLPQVARFSRTVINTAKARGFVFNWLGRVCHFSEHAYTAPNHLIQGGCADVIKLAMNVIDDVLRPYKSRMLLQVHDELLFKIHKSELDIVPSLVKIMESVYPHKHLPLTAGASYSWKSWADKVKGLPVGQGPQKSPPAGEQV